MLLDRNRGSPGHVDQLAEAVFRILGRHGLHGLTPAIDLLLLAKVARKAKPFSMRFRSINIFLLDSDPDGRTYTEWEEAENSVPPATLTAEC